MRNAGLEETQAGIKIAGRNINNLRYADDTTPMAESEEELKSLLKKVKVETEKGQFSFQSQRKEMPKNALISHASKVMLKILQARLQQHVNRELPDVQAGFRTGRRIRDQIANICWIIKKAREFQKNIDFRFIDYVRAFDCVDRNKLWKILKEMEYQIP